MDNISIGSKVEVVTPGHDNDGITGEVEYYTIDGRLVINMSPDTTVDLKCAVDGCGCKPTKLVIPPSRVRLIP